MITDEEITNAIELYDLAMSGDYDAIFKVLELYRKALAYDVNSTGLACAIENEINRRKHGNKENEE